MAPINLPDGSQVSEIVLPDGSTASEVLAPDGSTVFSGIPDSGISRLTFDSADIQSGSALDVWNDNDFAITGGTTGQAGLATTFDSGESISLDGTNDYLDNSSFPAFGPDWSVAFWYDAPDDSNDEYFWQSDQNRNGNDNSNSIAFGNSGTQFVVYGADGTRSELTSDANVRAGSPVHVVVTSSGTESSATLTLYLDGSQQNQLTGVSTINTTSSHQAYIGRRFDGFGNLSGNLDRYDWYSKELSSTEASDHYNTGSI